MHLSRTRGKKRKRRAKQPDNELSSVNYMQTHHTYSSLFFCNSISLSLASVFVIVPSSTIDNATCSRYTIWIHLHLYNMLHKQFTSAYVLSFLLFSFLFTFIDFFKSPLKHYFLLICCIICACICTKAFLVFRVSKLSGIHTSSHRYMDAVRLLDCALS